MRGKVVRGIPPTLFLTRHTRNKHMRALMPVSPKKRDLKPSVPKGVMLPSCITKQALYSCPSSPQHEDTREDSFNRQTAEKRETTSGDDINLYTPPAGSAQAVAAGVIAVGSEPASGESTLNAPSAPVPALRRRSTFAPGGNRFVYKQAFSARWAVGVSRMVGHTFLTFLYRISRFPVPEHL